MADKEALFKNIRILIQAAKILEIPILVPSRCRPPSGRPFPRSPSF